MEVDVRIAIVGQRHFFPILHTNRSDQNAAGHRPRTGTPETPLTAVAAAAQFGSRKQMTSQTKIGQSVRIRRSGA